MQLPGLSGYYDTLAAQYVCYLERCREDRERQREHEANGPVIRYVPYGGVYVALNEGGAKLGYFDRVNGQWVPAEPKPLLV